jgi:hypothetical protein
MTDVLLAARRELLKMGKTPSKADFGSYWDTVQELAPRGLEVETAAEAGAGR